MSPDDPVALDILRRAMVARIATISSHGRPSVNPLYFIYRNGVVWLGTADWTLAARNVRANPQVSLLLEVEQDPDSSQVLRLGGKARVRTDKETVRSYGFGVIRKYLLPARAMRNILAHSRQVRLQRQYSAQSKQRGQTCVIEVTPEQVELLANDRHPC